jgi:NAD(P)-dependent dehydrogenase (short-subunit alcohol dehydrogenase family)
MAAGKDLAHYPSLKGRHVLITGGASGIGAALVSAFAEQGSRVGFVDVNVEAGQALCDRLAGVGLHRPMFRNCDLRDIDALQATLAGMMEEDGDFDVLVNNAGNDDRHDLADVTPEYWDERIAINQRPMFFAIQALAPGMRRRGGGAIINFSSISWHISDAGYPVYATTKAAVLGLTRGLSRDLGKDRIRINTISPGWVMTERQKALWLDAEGEQEIDRSQHLPGRLQPWHVARMVLFLASDDAAMCTAQEFIVDGGWA